MNQPPQLMWASLVGLTMLLMRAFVLTAALSHIFGPAIVSGNRPPGAHPGHAYFEQPCCGRSHLRHHKEHVREFSCGILYYRTLYLDSKRDVLYVGAMDKVFRLNLSNISHSNCEVELMRQESKREID